MRSVALMSLTLIVGYLCVACNNNQSTPSPPSTTLPPSPTQRACYHDSKKLYADGETAELNGTVHKCVDGQWVKVVL